MSRTRKYRHPDDMEWESQTPRKNHKQRRSEKFLTRDGAPAFGLDKPDKELTKRDRRIEAKRQIAQQLKEEEAPISEEEMPDTLRVEEELIQGFYEQLQAEFREEFGADHED